MTTQLQQVFAGNSIWPYAATPQPQALRQTEEQWINVLMFRITVDLTEGLAAK